MIASVRSTQAARAGPVASASRARLANAATHLMALAYLGGAAVSHQSRSACCEGGDWGILPLGPNGPLTGGKHVNLTRLNTLICGALCAAALGAAPVVTVAQATTTTPAATSVKCKDGSTSPLGGR